MVRYVSIPWLSETSKISQHNNLLESQWNLPTKKTSSLHLLGQLSRGSWGGAVEEGEFLTGCSGRWNLGGMSNKNLLYAKCAKHVWHYLPTFHWYIESHMYGKHFIMNSSDFFDLTSIKKRRIQSVPRFNISIEVIKPLWRFQHLFFFLGGGKEFRLFFLDFRMQRIDPKGFRRFHSVYGWVYADFFDSFWGATGFFNVVMLNFSCVCLFDAALLHKVDLVMLSMQKMKFTA